MRQIKRRIEMRKRKEAKKKMKSLIDLMIDGMPDVCDSCKAEYNTDDKQEAGKWHVEILEEERRVSLLCPPCHERITTTLQDLEEAVEETKEMAYGC